MNIQLNDRVRHIYGEAGTVTRISKTLGCLVLWDNPADSGDGVISFDQWCRTEDLTRMGPR